MTTGTEGPDNLTNDPAVLHEVIDALGGDDTITIQRPNIPADTTATVTVHGDDGTDTLIMSGLVNGATASASGVPSISTTRRRSAGPSPTIESRSSR